MATLKTTGLFARTMTFKDEAHKARYLALRAVMTPSGAEVALETRQARDTLSREATDARKAQDVQRASFQGKALPEY